MTAEIAEATGGEVFGRETEVDGVAIDSRRVRRGDLFVPIVAERDGHDYIGAAVAAGAVAYLTSGPIEAGTAVRVADTAAALTALGSHARDRLPDRVVGVTGSVGKTSVKDILAAVAATTWRTSAATGSFNNELGVPLTLVNARDRTEVTVVEMGARGRGHIAELCLVARPTIGIVTVVAGAHLELFGSIDEVAATKGELVETLPPSGLAVLNADDERVVAMAERTDATVVTFGEASGDVRAGGVAGRHQVSNALAAAAAALAMGADVSAVADGLAAARLSAMRMDLTTFPDGLAVLDDSYNANPTSMLAALDALAALPAGRRVAVLGTMAELGSDAEAAHRAVAEAAAARGVVLVAVDEARYGIGGPDAVATPAEAVARLRELGVGSGDAVLVKASRAAGLEAVVTLLADA